MVSGTVPEGTVACDDVDDHAGHCAGGEARPRADEPAHEGSSRCRPIREYHQCGYDETRVTDNVGINMH